MGIIEQIDSWFSNANKHYLLRDSEWQQIKAELAKVREDAARWQAVVQSGSYCPSAFGNPIGFAGRTGQYSEAELNASVDSYIAERALKEPS